ncbi:MAG: hypothetical protein CLLPBCKN_004092 [Chroococcidiopsis cubana SAG 39.79]|nr:hypothetical protein [Chroococcidiopsis cubana SAG 39.79]
MKLKVDRHILTSGGEIGETKETRSSMPEKCIVNLVQRTKIFASTSTSIKARKVQAGADSTAER